MTAPPRAFDSVAPRPAGDAVPCLLCASRIGDTLLIQLSPDGTGRRLRPVGCFHPDWDGIRRVTQALVARSDIATARGCWEPSDEDEARRLGRWLFDELIPGDARACIANGRGPLQLVLDEALLEVPWEAMWAEEAIALQRPISRWPAFSLPDRASSRPDGRWRVGIVADPDGSLHAAFEEGTRLFRQVRAAGPAVELRGGDVDVDWLRLRWRDFDVVHLAGHIDADGLRMQDGAFGTDVLARMAGAGTMPWLLVNNGCRGGAAYASLVDGARPNEGLVLGALRAGVAHVVGPLHAIPDRLGRAFGLAVHAALLAGAPPHLAVWQARCALQAELGPGAHPWGLYVHWGDAGLTAPPSPEQRSRQDARAPGGEVTRLSPTAELEREPTRSALAPRVLFADSEQTATGRGWTWWDPAARPEWSSVVYWIVLGLTCTLLVLGARYHALLFDPDFFGADSTRVAPQPPSHAVEGPPRGGGGEITRGLRRGE